MEEDFGLGIWDLGRVRETEQFLVTFALEEADLLEMDE